MIFNYKNCCFDCTLYLNVNQCHFKRKQILINLAMIFVEILNEIIETIYKYNDDPNDSNGK